MNEVMHMLDAFEFRNEFWVLFLPIILMGFDVLTGFINAWIKKEIKSAKLRAGLGKKVGEIAILVIGEFFSFALRIPPEVMKFLSFYIILMEAISIFENLDRLGVPIPKFISKVLNNDLNTIQNADVKEVIPNVSAGNNRESNTVDGDDSPRS